MLFGNQHDERIFIFGCNIPLAVIKLACVLLVLLIGSGGLESSGVISAGCEISYCSGHYKGYVCVRACVSKHTDTVLPVFLFSLCLLEQ